MTFALESSKTHLRDLLNVPHRLETQLNLTKGGHVAGLGGRSPQHGGLGRNTAERTPSEHGVRKEGGRSVGRRCRRWRRRLREMAGAGCIGA